VDQDLARHPVTDDESAAGPKTWPEQDGNVRERSVAVDRIDAPHSLVQVLIEEAGRQVERSTDRHTGRETNSTPRRIVLSSHP
jgi:hypothetical protein